jgi:hypothetical protein
MTHLTPEIPEVFQRMPLETLRRYAHHGVMGARQELSRRRAGQKPRVRAGTFFALESEKQRSPCSVAK